MASDRGRALRVGLLVVTALVVLSVGVFLIGEKNHLFSPKVEYFSKFRNVSGLNPGNPVQLNGVDVGSVERVVLPEDPGESEIRVEIAIDRRYAERVRRDSEARIKTLGLLGDKFVEITSGSEGEPVIPPGTEIPAATSVAMDQLVESGEDVMANITEISFSLRRILARMEAGEGILGGLVTDTEEGNRVTDSFVETMESVQRVAKRLEGGEGTLPRLINDDELADRMVAAVERLEGVLGKVDEGEGLLPVLLNDGETAASFRETLASLKATSEDLSALSQDLRHGEGLLPQLLYDEEYGRQLKAEIQRTVETLNRLVGKLESGDGTAAQLINDPSVYEAIDQVIIGINESRLLRWLIRNRQKAGIEKSYEEALEQAGEGEPEGGPEDGGDPFPRHPRKH